MFRAPDASRPVRILWPSGRDAQLSGFCQGKHWGRADALMAELPGRATQAL
jgi:hypothetical protein